MRKLILAVIVLMALFIPAIAQQPDIKVKNFAHAIAMAEGFYLRGSLPNRCHNPGDITSSSRHAYPGQIGLNRRGYVIFKNDQYGWQALFDQIQRVIDGTSTRYNQSMTFAQIGRIYAQDQRWGKKVCGLLGITPKTTFEDYFDLPPKVRFAYDFARLPQALSQP